MSMAVFQRMTGWCLILLSGVSIVQTFREAALWRNGEATFESRMITSRPFSFASHSFDIADSLNPNPDSLSRTATIRLIMDGQSLGPASVGRLRTADESLGRYYGWFEAWIFLARPTNDSVLYLARRLQPGSSDAPQFEVHRVTSRGSVTRELYSGSQLTGDYRVFRSTRGLTNRSSALPLSVLPLAAFPVLFLVFPAGPLVIGAFLIGSSRRSRRPAAKRGFIAAMF
jgi:hypothetical protein